MSDARVLWQVPSLNLPGLYTFIVDSRPVKAKCQLWLPRILKESPDGIMVSAVSGPISAFRTGYCCWSRYRQPGCVCGDDFSYILPSFLPKFFLDWSIGNLVLIEVGEVCGFPVLPQLRNLWLGPSFSASKGLHSAHQKDGGSVKSKGVSAGTT